MDVLVTMGTNAAYFYSVYIVLRAATSSSFIGNDFFETSAMLISFILLGKYLEVLAKGKTSEAIAQLLELAPETATLLDIDKSCSASGGMVLSEKEISTQLIQRNDIIKILPGSKVPIDGTIVWGRSHLNESMITGESKPVQKKEGDEVIGGSINQSGVLHVRATRVGAETALAQIVRLVEAAQMAKAPVQKLADGISRHFVPFVSIPFLGNKQFGKLSVLIFIRSMQQTLFHDMHLLKAGKASNPVLGLFSAGCCLCSRYMVGLVCGRSK
jgi:Cu+-exporting ATPase